MEEVRTFYAKRIFFKFYTKKSDNGPKFKGAGGDSLRKRWKNSTAIKITETSCIFFLEFLRTQNVNQWEPRSRQGICSQKNKEKFFKDQNMIYVIAIFKKS